MANNLIIYYSRTGENYSAGGTVFLEKGNTERCAEYIQKAVGGDLFQIETVKDYPENYMKCTEVAKTEQKKKERPELKEYLESIEEYENVFICSPCWWGTCPMAMFTQLECLDWKGKKVLPLMTHEGSGLGSVEKDLKKTCKGATVVRGLAVRGSDTPTAEEAVARWAENNI